MKKNNEEILDKELIMTNLTTIDFSNIFVTVIGRQKKQPNHFFTNYFIRHDYCIQYVINGKGEYFINNKLYKLRKNTLFLLPKKRNHYYKADPMDPYDYYWIHFNGSGFENFLKAIHLSEDFPVLYDVENPNIENRFAELLETCLMQTSPHQNLLILSKCYALLFELLSGTKTAAQPMLNTFLPAVEQAVNYIAEHFTEKISLNDIAHFTHSGKCYLADIFKKSTGLSPIQYLIQYRISYACQLLKTNMTITEICYKCGFSELTNFLIRFKKIIGCTPTQYRKKMLNQIGANI